MKSGLASGQSRQDGAMSLQGMTLKRQHQQGFTLLEVMVALTILGLLLASATGALRLGSRSWEAGIERSGNTLEARVTIDFLRRNIAQMLPLARGEEASNKILFKGDRDELMFVAPAPRQLPGKGLAEYLLAVEAKQGGVELVLYHQEHMPDKDDFTVSRQSDSIVLLEGLKEAVFAYYGKSRRGGISRWNNQWSKRAVEYPERIRLKTVFSDPGKEWPELVFNIPARVQ
ncbi:MAG: prepilin-type N-terminal cleavage/methylation domain-containing protein [Candidatus Sedimenticola sp. PURPLELP]